MLIDESVDEKKPVSSPIHPVSGARAEGSAKRRRATAALSAKEEWYRAESAKEIDKLQKAFEAARRGGGLFGLSNAK